MKKIILVRGSGDVASAVAHILFENGYPVIMHDTPQPSATRRKMSFCDAIFNGFSTLAGVNSQHINNIPELISSLGSHDLLPITTLELPNILDDLKPDILIDARMRKHHQPEVQITLAPLTVGLGPNFTAGETVHAAVETGWNEELGKVIWNGPTRPLEGEPQKIAGHARDRYVYAPAAGIFRTNLNVGDMVVSGKEIARIDDTPLRANIDGMLRGLTHDGVPVAEKTKVIEVDPRGARAKISGIGERPGRIARGVLEAVKIWNSMNAG
ncbi:MAG: EF2563 family selenium-dependent molybdenum hydroxylase system protein [Acidobacteria bacterium]|nr:EF2563 family selenium-dependent molybdenum hydroxylase system protein [Acidobacteriota bacterium]